jgi:putative Mn2+ efflux pump MntP
MDFWWLLVLAVSLAMDCFAVSLGIGSSPLPTTFRRVFRIAFHFGFFQFLLLAWVGVRMIREGFSGEDEEVNHEDPSRGKTLIMLSLATSMDALGVGLSMALLKINILTSSLLIGLVTLLFSTVGMLVGNKLSEKFGERMEIAGGIVLLLIGLRILVTHLIG